ncbi:MAG: hypothetical protein EOP52_10160 [Sphingobacteriales bacterium]|nr:MAG: hypothetical protein EOP52_10160 [Sphingobacteriales bacterium]
MSLGLAVGTVAPDTASAQSRYKVKKKGWSKKAKGAAIGGVGGAVLGGVVGGTKGAVIGGAAGAGGGYLYGKRRTNRKGDNRATVIKRR